MRQASPLVLMNDVSKRFRRNMTNIRSTIGYAFGLSSPHDFWALKDISLRVGPGETLGIIGPNGAGKSTLLKILAHITRPTQGTITLHGRVGALIEVGAGFHPELTGRENIFLYGAILGMTKKEITREFDAIVAFSGLEILIDTPVKFYSTGMYLRLGFSVTIHMDPDILIIDEAMAVGDAEFQEKCFKKIEEFRARGKSIIVVSHDLQLIERYASSCIVLNNGMVVKEGAPQECTRWYYEKIMGLGTAHSVTFSAQSKPQFIQKVSMTQNGDPSLMFEHGDDLRIETIVENIEEGVDILLGIGIFGEGRGIFGVEKKMYIEKGSTANTLHIPHIPFLKGSYTIRVGIWKSSIQEVPIDYHDAVLSFSVASSHATKPYGGVVLLPHTWL